MKRVSFLFSALVLLLFCSTAFSQRVMKVEKTDGTFIEVPVKEVARVFVEGEWQSCPDANHPHWIDLGLPSGTQWRCCNERASTPEARGEYYFWGDVSTAPTLDQAKELWDNCSSEWITINGVNGRKFTGPNGGTIFLPAAGYHFPNESGGFDIILEGELGNYWTSTSYKHGSLGPTNVYSFTFNSNGVYYDGDAYEYEARPVRSVRVLVAGEPTALHLFFVDGSDEWFLFMKKPVVTFSESELTISTSDDTFIYNFDKVADFRFDTPDVDKVSAEPVIQTPRIIQADNAILVYGLGNDAVSLYDISGRKLPAHIQRSGEGISVSLHSLPRGSYIIRLNNQTIKVAKK